jgi:hypothetical protein
LEQEAWSTIIEYLAAAGIRTLGIIDDDTGSKQPSAPGHPWGNGESIALSAKEFVNNLNLTSRYDIHRTAECS